MNATYFFMMMYRKALPRVWFSSRNSKEAAVAVEPGSCGLRYVSFKIIRPSLGLRTKVKEQ